MYYTKRMNEDKVQLREKIIKGLELNEGDLMEDERGEYFLTDEEVGTPGEEGYDVRYVKVYLDELC